MKELEYYVSENELTSSVKWFPQVLQSDYNTYGSKYKEPYHIAFTKMVRELKKRFQNGEVTIDRANGELQEYVIELHMEYPEKFTKSREGLGYYSISVLVDYYLQGRLTLDTIPIKDVLEKRARLEEEVMDKRREKEMLGEERERLEIEAAILQEMAADRQLEVEDSARIPVEVGMLFSVKFDMDKAYKEIIDTELALLRKSPHNSSARARELAKCVEIEKVKKGWRVTNVLKCGGRAWMKD